jgi:hypothetical protein
MLETAFDDVPPFPVISIDHTFNVNRRTTEYVPAPDLDRCVDVENARPQHKAVAENAFLVAMGANQVVCYFDSNHFTNIKF